MTTQTELLREALELADAYANAFNNCGSSLYNPTTAAARKALADKIAALTQASQAAELAALKAENEALRKDAERLDALAATPSIVRKVGGRWYSRHESGFRKQEGLRQAIDAAMQTKEAS